MERSQKVGYTNGAITATVSYDGPLVDNEQFGLAMDDAFRAVTKGVNVKCVPLLNHLAEVSFEREVADGTQELASEITVNTVVTHRDHTCRLLLVVEANSPQPEGYVQDLVSEACANGFASEMLKAVTKRDARKASEVLLNSQTGGLLDMLSGFGGPDGLDVIGVLGGHGGRGGLRGGFGDDKVGVGFGLGGDPLLRS